MGWAEVERRAAQGTQSGGQPKALAEARGQASLPLGGAEALLDRLRAYWALIKSLQTGLLVITGVAGYLSARPRHATGPALALAGSLFLAVSGSTVLNMLYDRQIDACMGRTAGRPLPSGRISSGEALILGLSLAALGVAWAAALALPCGAIVLLGVLLDVVVYTIWLKQRTPWSIVWGGVAGGMPILAGRVLAVGTLDTAGFLLTLGVLLWIPTHVLTFSLKHAADYARAGVPVLPNTHGPQATRLVLGLSTVTAVGVMSLALTLTGVRPGFLHTAYALGVALLGLTLVAVLRPAPRLDFTLYKLASLYMLGTMGAIIIGG